MVKREAKPVTVKCRAMSKAWSRKHPDRPRQLIDVGEEIEWPASRKLPVWLTPLAGLKEPEAPKPEPRTMSEVQQVKTTRRPTGA